MAAPWSLADVNDSFEDDINAVDNDGGRRTAYGMFHTTKDAVMAATEDDRTSSAWHNGLQRILEDQKGIGRRHNKSSVSRQRRRRQNLDNLMKLEVRIAVSHSLLGRVGLRLWAAVRRDYITMDQHLERCRTAMLSITDEMLWNLCSGRGAGVGSADCSEDVPAWPYVKTVEQCNNQHGCSGLSYVTIPENASAICSL